MTDAEKMARIDELLSHVWMVRTFLKHCEEVEDDPELQSVHRELYDCMHAVGAAAADEDAASYLKKIKKKITKLRSATELFAEIQEDVSAHTNFRMARQSLSVAVEEVTRLIQS